jgi:hypothetical protein
VLKTEIGDVPPVTNLNYHTDGSTLANFQHAYNNALNISQIADSNGTHSYNYDVKSQLTSTHGHPELQGFP